MARQFRSGLVLTSILIVSMMGAWAASLPSPRLMPPEARDMMPPVGPQTPVSRPQVLAVALDPDDREPRQLVLIRVEIPGSAEPFLPPDMMPPDMMPPDAPGPGQPALPGPPVPAPRSPHTHALLLVSAPLGPVKTGRVVWVAYQDLWMGWDSKCFGDVVVDPAGANAYLAIGVADGMTFKLLAYRIPLTSNTPTTAPTTQGAAARRPAIGDYPMPFDRASWQTWPKGGEPIAVESYRQIPGQQHTDLRALLGKDTLYARAVATPFGSPPETWYRMDLSDRKWQRIDTAPSEPARSGAK